MTFDSIRRAVACICDGYTGLSCDVAGDECAMREELGGAKVAVPIKFSSESFLLEQARVHLKTLNLHKSALMSALEHGAREAKARDDAYLAGLAPFERRKVLALRTIHKKRRHAEAWLEENVTWRFAKERPDNEW